MYITIKNINRLFLFLFLFSFVQLTTLNAESGYGGPYGFGTPASPELIKKWDIDVRKSFMIGDRWRDIQAGINAGCKTFFIDNNYNEDKLVEASYTSANLLGAVIIIEKL